MESNILTFNALANQIGYINYCLALNIKFLMKLIKKSYYNLIAFLIVVSFSSCGYNAGIDLEEGVASQWAQVENVYQRRADLIPNLVETVKGAANFEKETLEAVVQARSKATGITIDPTNITPDALQKFQQAQDGLSSSLSRLLVSVEKYPELKANANFQNLQSQIEGSENRISTERKKFNDVVKTYNSHIRKFPTNITAGIFGFEKKGYFEADKGAEKAPSVKF